MNSTTWALIILTLAWLIESFGHEDNKYIPAVNTLIFGVSAMVVWLVCVVFK